MASGGGSLAFTGTRKPATIAFLTNTCHKAIPRECLRRCSTFPLSKVEALSYDQKQSSVRFRVMAKELKRRNVRLAGAALLGVSGVFLAIFAWNSNQTTRPVVSRGPTLAVSRLDFDERRFDLKPKRQITAPEFPTRQSSVLPANAPTFGHPV